MPPLPFWMLLDRDGTLNREVEYLSRPEQIELLPGVAGALRELRSLGGRLIVVTNQSGIARGYFSGDDLAAIHARFRELLIAEGVEIDLIVACPHGPHDDCRCRKPRPGMFEEAESRLGPAPALRFMVGDRGTDLAFGRATGARTILVRTGYGSQAETDWGRLADFVANDFAGAVAWVKTVVTHPGTAPREDGA